MSLTGSITKKLHKKRPAFIQEAVSKFYDTHGYYDEELRKKLEREADRFYPMVIVFTDNYCGHCCLCFDKNY